MPIITPASINAMFSGFRAAFEGGYQNAMPCWDKIATLITSTGEQETYAWQASVPRFREWVGERVFNTLAAHSYTLPNKDWENSFEVPRNKIEDDSYGVFSARVKALGEAAKLWPDDMVLAALEAGDGTLCYDGQFFFDTDHPVDLHDAAKGTQANLLTGTAFSQVNYYAAKAAMMKFKDESGERMGIMPDLVIVPPALEKTAREVLKAGTISQVFGSNTAAAAAFNVSNGECELKVWERLTSDTTWYMLCTKKPIKPLIFQQRKAPEFVDKANDPRDENVFNRKAFVYGADARGNVGYSLPFLAIQCNA
jgi:phage major head subunit gpT-like protein